MVEEAENEDLGVQGELPVVTETPEREIELEDLGDSVSLAEAEEETSHQSDLQAVLKYLHPKFKDKRMNDVLQPIMASRVFPDNHLDLNYLLTMYMIEEHEGSPDIDFLGIVTGNQAGTSIGYEGRGRIEDLEVAGVAHEQEMEKLSKELGLT